MCAMLGKNPGERVRLQAKGRREYAGRRLADERSERSEAPLILKRVPIKKDRPSGRFFYCALCRERTLGKRVRLQAKGRREYAGRRLADKRSERSEAPLILKRVPIKKDRPKGRFFYCAQLKSASSFLG